MVSAEDVIRSKVARVARIVLATLPPHLPSVENARALLRVATGEDYTPPRSKWHQNTSYEDTGAMLYCHAYHLLGAARRFDSDDLGQELRKTPTLRVTLEALRQALHRDFVQVHMEHADCVDFLCEKLGGATLTTVQANNNQKKQFVVEKLVQEADERQRAGAWARKVNKVNRSRKRGNIASGQENEMDDPADVSGELEEVEIVTNPHVTDQEPSEDSEAAKMRYNLQGLKRIELQDLCREQDLPVRDGYRWLNDERLINQIIDKRMAAEQEDEQDASEGHDKRNEPEHTEPNTRASKRRKRCD
jgi:hypothetical protein